MIAETIQEFGKKMGIEQMELSDQKVVHLSMEGVGELYLEEIGGDLLIYLLKEVEKVDYETLKEFLRSCHYREKRPFGLSASLHGENELVFSLKIYHEDISTANIQKAVDFLMQSQDRMSKLEQK